MYKKVAFEARISHKVNITITFHAHLGQKSLKIHKMDKYTNKLNYIIQRKYTPYVQSSMCHYKPCRLSWSERNSSFTQTKIADVNINSKNSAVTKVHRTHYQAK